MLLPVETEVVRVSPEFGDGDALQGDRVLMVDVEGGVAIGLICVADNPSEMPYVRVRQNHGVVMAAADVEIGDGIVAEARREHETLSYVGTAGV